MEVDSAFRLLVLAWSSSTWLPPPVTATAVDLTEWRAPRPKRADVLAEVIGRCGRFEFFRERLDENRPGGGADAVASLARAGSLRGDLRGAHDLLEKQGLYFAFMSYMYVVALLKMHCEYALALLEDLAAAAAAAGGHGDPASRAREALEFPDAQDYCVFTALHVHGFPHDGHTVDAAFEHVFFLRAVAADDVAGDRDRLTAVFRGYLAEYDRITGFDETVDRVLVDRQKLADKLDGIKSDIADFSGVFCASYAPYVDKRLLGPTGDHLYDDDAASIESRFVRHAFRAETCLINVSM